MATKYLDQALVAPLLLLNFAFYVIVLGIAGWSLNTMITEGDDTYGNAATPNFVVFTMLAGAVGVASVMISHHLINGWSGNNISIVISATLISWAILLLAFGLACKEISIGHSNTTLKFMEIFVIVLGATYTLYLLVLYSNNNEDI